MRQYLHHIRRVDLPDCDAYKVSETVKHMQQVHVLHVHSHQVHWACPQCKCE